MHVRSSRKGPGQLVRAGVWDPGGGLSCALCPRAHTERGHVGVCTPTYRHASTCTRVHAYCGQEAFLINLTPQVPRVCAPAPVQSASLEEPLVFPACHLGHGVPLLCPSESQERRCVQVTQGWAGRCRGHHGAGERGLLTSHFQHGAVVFHEHQALVSWRPEMESGLLSLLVLTSCHLPAGWAGDLHDWNMMGHL